MTYDAARRLTSVTAPAPFDQGAGLVQTVTAYDPDGRVIQVSRSNGGTPQVTRTRYGPSGQVVAVTDPNGNVTTSQYDAADRLQAVSQPVAPGAAPGAGSVRVTRFGYDALGRLATVTDNAGNVAAQYGYTPNGNRASFTDAHVPAGTGNTTSFAYDGLDRLSTTTWPGGSTETLTYDDDGNPVTRTTRRGDLIGFAWDALFRRCRKTVGALAGQCGDPVPGVPTVTWRYDLAGRVTAVTDNSPAIAAAAPAAGPSVGYAATLRYDALNRPTAIGWSPAAAPVASVGASVAFAHAYNGVNQRTGQTATDNGWWQYPPATASTTGYTANNLNQYTAITGAASVTPTYDADGNLTFDGSFTYGYDAESRLVSVTQGGSPVASYAYDGQGRRKLKTVGGTTTITVTDPEDRAVLEYDGSSGQLQAWLVYGTGPNDVLSRMDLAGGGRTTFMADIQGSILATQDAVTGAVTRRGYLPYGAGASTAGPFGYTGQRIDPETNGLYYYRARMYAPLLGRFMQPDPIGYAGGGNLYAYVGNDPLNLVDPNGLVMEQITSGAINLTQRAFGPYVDAIQNFVLRPIGMVAGAVAQTPLGDPGFYASAQGAGPPGALAAGVGSLGAYGLRGLAALGRASEIGGPTLPSMESAGGKTLGLLRTPVGDTPLISGTQGAASAMPTGSAGFDIVTRTHVEGHAAAIMQQQGLTQGTLYINNPAICPSCARNLPNMLPSGSNLNVVLPNGTVVPFTGAP